MDNGTLIEIIGYIGSGLVLVSFLMASVVKLRIVNTIGSLIFTVYALIIHSYPTAIMNACLVIINLVFLYKLRMADQGYEFLTLSPKESFVQFFLDKYSDDIKSFFPNRDIDPAGQNSAYMVCRNAEPVGILLGDTDNGTMDITLDYSTPAFRDCSVGAYMMDKLPETIHKVRYQNPESTHIDYLKKLGFQNVNGVYEKER